MSDFLTDLEDQLRHAHPRRRAARRRKTAARIARELPVVLLVLIVLGSAVAFVTQVGSGDPGVAPDRGATPPAAAPEPTFTEADPKLPAGSVVVLNASGTPGRARAFAEVARTRREIAAVGMAPERLRRSVVAYASGSGKAARTVANGLDLDVRLLRDDEPVAARGADVAVLVGEDVLGAELRTLRSPGGGVVGKVGQIQRAGAGRLVAVATAQAAGTTVELRPCREQASCTVGVFGTSPEIGFTTFGVRFAGRTVVLRRGTRTLATAQFGPTQSRAITSQAVSILDTVARQPRGGRSLTGVLQRETTIARSAWTPPALKRTTVEYAPGAQATATRLARRFAVRARPFGKRLTRDQAGLEAGVAVRLGQDFSGARLVRLDRSTVSVVRYGRESRKGGFEEFCALNPGACDAGRFPAWRAVVTAEIDAPRGSVVTFEQEGKVVHQATNTGAGVDVAFSLPLEDGVVLEVAVDGRRVGVVPLGAG